MDTSILHEWGIQDYQDVSVVGNQEMEAHVWKVDDKYYLKCVDDIRTIENLYRLSSRLYEYGVPVAVPIKAKNNSIYIMENEKAYYLTPKLPGETFNDFDTFDWSSYGYLVGEAIGTFHVALKKCENIVTCVDRDYYDHIIAWAVPIIKKSLAKDEMDITFSIFDEYRIAFKDIYIKLPRQLIHNDFHGNNILFQGKKLSGFIDLDTYERNVRIFDPINFASWLLWRMRDDREGWFIALEAVLQGYNSICGLTAEEINGVFYFLYSMELYCIAAFSEKNIGYKVKHSINTLRWLLDMRKNIKAVQKNLLIIN